MRARWRWVFALLVLFLGGAAGGWLLSTPHGTDAVMPVSKARADRGLNARLRQVKTEVARARTGKPAADEVRAKAPRSAFASVTVAIDPGHNGGNATHPEQIGRLVPAGANGTTKACNTTGTETDDGDLTEAQFNLDVAKALAAQLRSRGAKIVMTRTNNDGVGPCVDKRAEIGNEAGTDAAISIHADGNLSPGARGFDVIHPSPDEMVRPAIATVDRDLAIELRDALLAAGIPSANYVGKKGLDERDDLAGLNLSTQPIALVELGNMRSAEEARRFESPSYRTRLANALALGLQGFLESR